MKKHIIILEVILLLSISTISISINAHPQQGWTGFIRIEGENNTIWYGKVTVEKTTITALNESTGKLEQYLIPYPSVLGALDEASKKGDFTYNVTYYQSWHAFLVTSIRDDSNWWHFWVDYNLPMVDAGSYKLKDNNEEILWGYLEDWYAHALRINVDKIDVHRNEEIKITVFNETMNPVEKATVHIDSQTYTTDENGCATIKLPNKGDYTIYAEKNGYIRSEKITVHVKILNITMIHQPLLTYLLNLLNLNSFSSI